MERITLIYISLLQLNTFYSLKFDIYYFKQNIRVRAHMYAHAILCVKRLVLIAIRYRTKAHVY